jgi:hypothetical protein
MKKPSLKIASERQESGLRGGRGERRGGEILKDGKYARFDRYCRDQAK